VHPASCACGACRHGTALFADAVEEVSSEDAPAEVVAEEVPAEVATEEVPAEVVAEDAPAEVAAEVVPAVVVKKKRAPKGKDLSEFKVGTMVSGSVKSITNYGAFVDIGASTDGLLHISQLSAGYVANVGDILEEGQDVEVRIVAIDASKGQVGLSLMTAEEAASSGEPRGKPRQQRRDDSSILSSLMEKGWETSAFVEGTVVSTVDFGCFVRVSATALNSECEGEFDGLVHISALAARRVNSVTDVVSADQKVQVRVKSIAGNKVSLTMLSLEDEDAKKDFGAPSVPQGAKDWKESLAKMDDTQPVFKNGIVTEDRRK
jgi:small subunit ribosomal protein S1